MSQFIIPGGVSGTELTLLNDDVTTLLFVGVDVAVVVDGRVVDVGGTIVGPRPASSALLKRLN